MNIALLLKWIWKLYQGAEGLWADLLRAKYLGERDIFAAETPTRGSQFWMALQKIKWYFKLGAKHHVENGGKTYFWFDWWLGSAHLKDRFPSLFDICALPSITVRDAFQGEEWGIVFRRSFGLPEAVDWDNLTRELDGVRLTPVVDRVSWMLDPSRVFTTSSIYGKMSQGAAVSHFDELWCTKVPPRVRIFLWQLIRGRLPCCEQVAKRRGPSDGNCALCGEIEDCNHIFFSCPVAKFMWAGVRELLGNAWNPTGVGDFLALANGPSRTMRRVVWFTFAAQSWALWIVRNKLTIEGKLINKPADVMVQMMIFMQQWRALARRRDRDLLDATREAVRRLHARMAG
jgi:hypothetical protein